MLRYRNSTFLFPYFVCKLYVHESIWIAYYKNRKAHETRTKSIFYTIFSHLINDLFLHHVYLYDIIYECFYYYFHLPANNPPLYMKMREMIDSSRSIFYCLKKKWILLRWWVWCMFNGFFFSRYIYAYIQSFYWIILSAFGNENPLILNFRRLFVHMCIFNDNSSLIWN